METENYKDIEVTYKFFLPEHFEELRIFQTANKLASALSDIHDACRFVWKYKEDATDQEIDLAEKIGDLVSNSGVFDYD